MPIPVVPPFGRVMRGLPPGLHPYLAVLPGAAQSPAMRRIEKDPRRLDALLRGALVRIQPGAGFAYVDVETPAIVLAEDYYRAGTDLDLYLDMLHELAHIRQHHEGKDLWDERYAYVDRPTEIEGYAIAVEEGRRLGMSEEEVVAHLSNPWMDADDVRALVEHVRAFLSA